MPKKKTELTAFTICTKNYLSFARSLTDSFLKFHPEAKVFVLLLDKVDGYFDPRKERFKTIEIDELKNVKRLKSFIFKYDLIGLNTAVKPFAVEHLFKNYAIEKLIYFDTDILIFDRLSAVTDLLEANNIVLIPHILTPLPDDGMIPSETDFLLSGSYNLGFIALRNTSETRRFVRWWQGKTYDGAVSQRELGMFRDQKPVDLVPSLFKGVAILRELGYNVAYWNLHEHSKFAKKEGRYFVNEEPIVFFHYSGYSLDDPEIISKHQNRHRFDDFNKTFRELFTSYRGILLKNGYKESIKWPNSFGQFDNGVNIPQFARDIYWSLGERRYKFGNPFRTKGGKSYFSWLNKPYGAGAGLTNFLWQLWRSQPDLRAAFPKIGDEDLTAFLIWCITSLEKKYQIDEAFVAPLRREVSKSPSLKIGSWFWRLVGYRRLTSLKRVFSMVFGDHIFRIVRGATHRIEIRLLGLKVGGDQRRSQQGMKEPKFGVNVFGYLDTESGLGECARALVLSFKKARMPYAVRNVKQEWLRRKDKTIKAFSRSLPYSINLLVINADTIQEIMKQMPKEFWESRYNIGFWHWELSNFPVAWRSAFKNLDEIWVSSDFTAASISKLSPVPVVKIPWLPKITFGGRPQKGRLVTGGDLFTFLFVYDSASYVERKNPLAVIAAFKNAFSKGDKVGLILKTTNATPTQLNQLKEEFEGYNITLINKYCDKKELLDLIKNADCVISLHRSEGYGATLLEAMALGKPVIATAYSGNMDFMTVGNSYPVKYDLVKIKEDIGVYKKGNVWAEPDPEHAAQLMRKVYENKKEAKRIGRAARKFVEENYGTNILSGRLRGRLGVAQERYLLKSSEK